MSTENNNSNTMITNLRRLSTRSALLQQNVAQNLGLYHTDLKAIALISEFGSLTASELGKETGLTTGTVTALIDRLEEAGYVTRKKDQNDRRRVIIVPVKEREYEIKKEYKFLVDSITKLCSSFNQTELEIVQKFIKEVTSIYENEIERLSK